MDIAIVGEKSLRIKSKNTSFIVNPEKKIEEDVVVLTSKPQDYSSYQEKLVIDGPGDFEAAGVSIRGEVFENGISFDFLEEGQRLVVLSSPVLAKTKEIEDATAVVVFLAEPANDDISKITCDVVAVIGAKENLPQDRTSVKKIDKLNLKKTEEYKGFTIHLSK